MADDPILAVEDALRNAMLAGDVAAISTPASTGPASCVTWPAAERIALTLATACSSSPATSGTTSREDA